MGKLLGPKGVQPMTLMGYCLNGSYLLVATSNFPTCRQTAIRLHRRQRWHDYGRHVHAAVGTASVASTLIFCRHHVGAKRFAHLVHGSLWSLEDRGAEGETPKNNTEAALGRPCSNGRCWQHNPNAHAAPSRSRRKSGHSPRTRATSRRVPDTAAHSAANPSMHWCCALPLHCFCKFYKRVEMQPSCPFHCMNGLFQRGRPSLGPFCCLQPRHEVGKMTFRKGHAVVGQQARLGPQAKGSPTCPACAAPNEEMGCRYPRQTTWTEYWERERERYIYKYIYI